MTEPETVQYFQFDSQGNMFIFAPGAGCTGDLLLVRPGDELTFTSMYTWEQFRKENASEMSVNPDTGLALSCPAASDGIPSRHFNDPLMEDALVELTDKNFSPETMKKIRWVRKMYREWRSHRHSLGLEYIECDLEDKDTITCSSLKFALCRFITEVKKVNGDDFPGKTLYDIIVCIQFHLECLGFAYKLINDEGFHDLKYTLDNTMKMRTAAGIGISVKNAQILSSTDEDYLWSMGFLGTSTPDQLLDTVVFCIGKGFALHVGKEHRALHSIQFQSQFKFMHDNDGEIFLRYIEDIGLKTKKGGLKHHKVEAKSMDLYATSNPDRCPLCIIIRYLSLLPKNRSCQAFYLQPRKKFFGKSWYVNRPAGVNRLRNVVKELCKNARLPGFYTNHSLRSMAATKLYQNSIDEQIIQEITGHRSLAVQSYKRTSHKQRKFASQCIFSK